jgi:hypothetical protein
MNDVGRETVDTLHTWLHTEAIDLDAMDAFVSAYCEKLRELNLTVDRFFCGAAILHPQVAACTWKWEFPLTITEGAFTREQQSKLPTKRELGTGAHAAPIIQLMNGAEVRDRFSAVCVFHHNSRTDPLNEL